MDGSGNEESGTAATDPIPVKPLAPCPFCGGTNVESCYSSWEFYRVDCESCGASGPRADVTQVEEFDRDAAEALACESWNRRVPAQESHDHPPGPVHRDHHAAVVAQIQVDRAGVIDRPSDGRWRECRHHHHGCACREHDWEAQVATLAAECAVLRAELRRLVERLTP
jgi:Lar family restriction alleviation protein